ncbi:MAG: glycosyltransferase family 39 protein [Pseudomonadota bacterium]|nr:glycosyltransferase family 39 protein [Pseudomonadota bacterium]
MNSDGELPLKALNGTLSMPDIRGNISFFQRHQALMLTSLGLLVCLYLIWPAFHAVHLEGFTAQTQSIALLKALAPGVQHDPYLPLVSQFIEQTRSAVIDVLSLIYRVFPQAGDLAFKGLVLASFIFLFASAMFFAKCWGGVRPIFSFFALVLTPGIPETAFFFNDNIVSAAFACIALALISKDRQIIKCLLSGAFLGLAILSRIDAIFMFPMVIGLVFYACESRRERLIASFIICQATLLVLTLSGIFHGFSMIDAFVTARKFVINQGDQKNWFWIRIFYFGLGALPFLVTGAWLNFKLLKARKKNIGLLVFIIYPALLALLAPKATEVRYIFPLLAPMVALHAGTGLAWVYQQCLSGGKRKFRYATGIIAFSGLVAIIPPAFLKMHDGPRAVFGRLWTPILWSRWQDSVNETTARTQRLVAILDDEKSNILISTHYNDEFYSRLRLMEAGFLPLPASSSHPACHGFSLFKKGRSMVFHIRTDPQYRIAPITPTYNAALQISAAFSCDFEPPYSKVYITTFGKSEGHIPPAVYAVSSLSFDRPLMVEFGDLRASFSPDKPQLRRTYGILDFKQMALQEITETRLKAEAYISAYPEADPVTGKTIKIENYNKYYDLSTGPTKRWLMKIQEKIGLGEDDFNFQE